MLKTIHLYDEEFKENNYNGNENAQDYVIKEGKNNILISLNILEMGI